MSQFFYFIFISVILKAVMKLVPIEIKPVLLKALFPLACNQQKFRLPVKTVYFVVKWPRLIVIPNEFLANNSRLDMRIMCLCRSITEFCS